MIKGHEAGGQLSITSEVENFPGFPHGILGPELVENMENVGAKLNAVADGAELRRAFQDANGTAALRQSQRRGQPA